MKTPWDWGDRFMALVFGFVTLLMLWILLAAAIAIGLVGVYLGAILALVVYLIGMMVWSRLREW